MTKTGMFNDKAALLSVMVIHGSASLVHFIHNAVYIRDYPNLPGWLTAGMVYAAWLAITAIGVMGFFVYRRRSVKTGLGVIALYALFGFGGFDHYLVAPYAAHTATMNTTIAIEGTTAAVLLVYVVALARKVLVSGESFDKLRTNGKKKVTSD